MSDTPVIGPDNPPDISKLNPSVHSVVRGKDPWHRDAFPDEFADAMPGGDRAEGWFLLDYWGNDIGFNRDGEQVP